MPREVVIVGAGITGLAAAYYLEKRAREQNVDLHCTLIESSDAPGGKIKTEHADNFIVEGGPDSFVTDKPWGLQLCYDLGIANQLIPNNQRDNKVYVLKNKRLIELPMGFRLTIPTKFWPFVRTPLISPFGKLRMAMDYFIRPRRDDSDESLGQFIGRRMGREAVEKFAGPFMAGIYVSDPDRMSMKSTFPRFLAMEKNHGSLIKAALASKKNPPKRSGPAAAGNAMFNSFSDGMQTLVDALSGALNCEKSFGTSVQSIEKKEGRFNLTLAGQREGVIEADDVVLAVSARVASPLLDGVHHELAKELQGIRFVNTATVSLAYLKDDLPADRPLDGFGVIIPPGEGRNIIACTWTSTKFKHRAPSDAVLIRVFVGGYKDEMLTEQSETALAELAHEEVSSMLGICSKPLFTNVFKWPKGNPQYDELPQ